MSHSLDLVGKAFCIFGLPDSGKSTLANYILRTFGPHAFVYDTLHEYPSQPFDSYDPDLRSRNSVQVLERVVRQIMASRRYRLFVLDEANRFCPSKPKPLPAAIADLNDFRAHYDIAVGYICRRPSQLNQDLTELAHYLMIFSLPGKRDQDYLNEVSRGLGDAISKVPKYHFILVKPDRSWGLMSPVPREFATDKKIRAPGTEGG